MLWRQQSAPQHAGSFVLVPLPPRPAGSPMLKLVYGLDKPVRRAPGRWEPGTSGRSSGALPEARHVAASAKYASTCRKFRISTPPAAASGFTNAKTCVRARQARTPRPPAAGSAAGSPAPPGGPRGPSRRSDMLRRHRGTPQHVESFVVGAPSKGIQQGDLPSKNTPTETCHAHMEYTKLTFQLRGFLIRALLLQKGSQKWGT
jgi:hypothetical protein